MELREGGGNCLNTLKGGGTEKRGRETKILKRRGARAGSRVGYLKKRGGGVAGTPLGTMHLEVFLFRMCRVTLKQRFNFYCKRLVPSYRNMHSNAWTKQ